MTRIEAIRLAPIRGAFTYDDITALQQRSIPEADRWTAPGVTPGFRHVREVATGVGVGVQTKNGLFWGDCIAVSYSGKAGRHPMFRTEEGLETLKRDVLPNLIGKTLPSFREAMRALETSSWHTAIAYGVSQAILKAVGADRGEIPALTLCREYDLSVDFRPVPLQGSCGNDRLAGAEKMIVSRLAALPHTQVDDIPAQLGANGDVLIGYAAWLTRRIRELAGDQYRPTLHLDVHGAIGKIFAGNTDRIVDYLARLKEAAAPHPLRVESVVLEESLSAQIEEFGEIRRRLAGKGVSLDLVADEWANTKANILEFAKSGAVDMIHIKMPDVGGVQDSVESVLGCREAGVKTLLGGSCIETEISAQVSVHVAMATRPTVLLAKPGMGIFEAIMLASNEMNRLQQSV